MNVYTSFLLCVALVFKLCPALSQSQGPVVIDDDTVYILPFEGVGKIKLHESKRREVKEQFGKGSITRSWRHKKYGIGELFKIQTDIYYKEFGICFQIYRSYGNRTVQTIIIDSTSPLATADEIQIGSRIEELRKSLGDARFMRNIGLNDYSYLHYSLYRTTEANSYIASINFYCFEIVEEQEFVVEEIGLSIIASPIIMNK